MNRKELAPESSPQAAYGAHLRKVREGFAWTQQEVADKVEYASSHMSAVETGRKSPTLRLSRRLDRAFGISERGESFERMWREMKRGSLLEGFPEYVGYEARAVELRLYEIGIIPGLLQTPEYAKVLADSAVRRGTITPEQGAERVQFLAERQAALARERPPMVFVTMDESCIRRNVGGRDVMDAQLESLVAFAELPNTLLQVAPFDIGERRPFNLPVYILTMPDRSLMSYAESQAQGHFEREGTSVISMLTEYHQLQAEALCQAASVAMIKQLRKGTL
ncbi:helix-turn-helix domain-containing protein [Streptomyces sp. BBFR102]|uniref:helix-turn-helix domain-containing protein n=1 Tax=Streptomyces sp. BBFR102 TaxID=3448171 RepID=UPI003F532101